MGDQLQHVTLTQTNEGVARPAHTRGILGDHVENSANLGGRGTDDPQHLGGRGLLFERLLEFAGAKLELLLEALARGAKAAAFAPDRPARWRAAAGLARAGSWYLATPTHVLAPPAARH